MPDNPADAKPPRSDKPPWLELRIHGVSGTPVKDMLELPGRPAIPEVNFRRLTDGSSPGQFWKRTDLAPRELEAYHWGEYTSQQRWSAFWVLLLPFGVINAAQFMLPAPRNLWCKVLHAAAGSCLRVIGLALSLLAFLCLAFVSMDLIGWYGAGHRIGRHYWAVPACALLLAAALGLIGLLSWQRLDGRSPAPQTSTPTRLDPAATGLHREGFYTGAVRSPDARRLHSAAILSMLATLTAWPGAQASADALAVARVGAVSLLILVAAVVAFSGDPEGGSSVVLSGRFGEVVRKLQGGLLKVISWTVWIASIAFLGWTAISAWREDLRLRSPVETLPGFDDVATWLLTASIGGLLALFVMVALLAISTRTPRGGKASRAQAFRRYAWGLTTWFATALGVFIGVGFAGSFAVLPAVGIGVWEWCSHHHRQAFHLPFPTILQRVLYAWGWTAVALLLFAATLVVIYLAQLRAGYHAAATRAYEAAAGDPLATDVGKRVGFWMFCARGKNLIPFAGVFFGTFGVGLSVAAAIERFRWAGSRWFVMRALAGSDGKAVVSMQVLGTLLLVLLVLGVAWETYSSLHSLSSRRALNVVWDVICFWPRSVHPLVPAAYSQFVVAEFRQYLSGRLASDEHLEVVVAAHSQGSLISLATLLWLPQAERERVGFLSFGSQLRQMYPRAFPAYVNAEVLDYVQSSISGRWLNLYRDTDHIAGPLFSWAHYRLRDEKPQAASWTDERRVEDRLDNHGRRESGPEWRLLDPMLTPTGERPAADARPQKHSAYWLDNSWDDAIYAVRPSSPATARAWVLVNGATRWRF